MGIINKIRKTLKLGRSACASRDVISLLTKSDGIDTFRPNQKLKNNIIGSYTPSSRNEKKKQPLNYKYHGRTLKPGRHSCVSRDIISPLPKCGGVDAFRPSQLAQKEISKKRSLKK